MTAVAAEGRRPAPGRASQAWRFVRRNPTMVIGAVILSAMALAAAMAPFYAGDALTIACPPPWKSCSWANSPSRSTIWGMG